MITSAQLTAVRCSWTLTCRTPPRGYTNTNILHVPFRIYSESNFWVSPGRISSGPLYSPSSWVWLFIHTYQRNSRVIWLFINVQNLLHAGYEFCVIFGRDALVGVLWGRSVRRECPSGVGLQTIWIMSASALPSTLSNAALELGMIL